MPTKLNLANVELIGIHGYLNAGKDTLGRIIKTVSKDDFPLTQLYEAKASYVQGFDTYAFAKPIKDACQIIFGFAAAQLEDRVLKELVDPRWGISPRKAMQLLGTEFGRDMIAKDIWLRRAIQQHQQNMTQGIGTVITDVRFENEAELIRSHHNAVMIFIVDPHREAPVATHGSEAGVKFDPERDLLIINDKTKGHVALVSTVTSMMEIDTVTEWTTK